MGLKLKSYKLTPIVLGLGYEYCSFKVTFLRIKRTSYTLRSFIENLKV